MNQLPELLSRRRPLRQTDTVAPEANEIAFPHIVEISAPLYGVSRLLKKIRRFHRDRSLAIRRGVWRPTRGQFYMRWCFDDPAVADAFKDSFGGERLTSDPFPDTGQPRLRG
jgi:hypothetical protein